MFAAFFAASVMAAPFLRMQVDVFEYGLHGSGTIVVDRASGRYARRFSVGPASDGDGFDGTSGWISDAGNAAFEQGNADMRARIATWSRLLSRFGGTSAPSHTSIRVGNDTEKITFSDERRIEGGGTVPFLVTIRDQQGSRVIRVRRVDTSRTLPPDAFAPPVLPSDFGIDDASAIASVPLLPLRYHGRELPLVVVSARVNSGPPMRFLLDTGGSNLLTSLAAKQLHLRGQGAIGVGGTGAGTMRAALANVDTLTIGAAHLRRQSFMILPLESMLPGIDGIVGAELLARFCARIDYRQRRLSLAVESPQTWFQGALTSRITFDKDMPDIGGSIGAVPGRFTLDTGSVGGLDINAPFAEANGLYARYHARASKDHTTGVGGVIQTSRIRVDRVRLGALRLTDVPATLAYKGGGVTDDPTIAGNVGEKVFTRFAAVVFDYRKQSLAVQRFAPNVSRPQVTPESHRAR